MEFFIIINIILLTIIKYKNSHKMVELKNIKINQNCKILSVLILNNDGTIFGGCDLKINRWKKEYEKIYNSLNKTGKEFKIFVMCGYVKSVDEDEKVGKIQELLFQDTITNSTKN